MAEYTKLVSYILENIGGKDNVDNVTHCVTRLRFKLKDDSKINKDKIEEHKEVITSQFAGGKFQVVIGTHVADVYEEVLVQVGTSNVKESTEKEGSLLDRFTSTITQIITPVLGVLGGCALVLALSSVLVATGLIQEGDGAQIILSSIGNACLTFFPVILGYTSAKAFGLNPFIGMALGSVLMFPGLLESINAGDPLYTVFENTVFAIPVHSTFFGIPIMFPSTGYTSSVIPIVFVTFIASKVEKFAKNHIPNALKAFMVPTATMLVAGVLGLLLVGPISIILTNAISAGVTFLFDKSAILAIVVITLIYQPLVILGLHWALISVAILNFVMFGSDVIISTLWTASFAHLAVCLAVYLRTKSQKMKGIALPAVVSACFCIIEPSIYGVTLPVKKRFIFCMISGMLGGLVLGLTNSRMYAVTMGVTGFPGFINPQTGDLSGMFMAVIAVAVTMSVGFALTWFTYKPGEDGANEDDINQTESKRIRNNKEVIYSPMKGQVLELSEMSDKAFANSNIGKGICIIPEEGKVVAPCDGEVSMVFPTGHAIGITSNNGAEILIHVGTNTVQLSENVFKKSKKVGDKVKKGDVLLTFDLKDIEKEGYNTETAVILSNFADYLDVINTCGDKVSYKDELFVTVVSMVAPNVSPIEA